MVALVTLLPGTFWPAAATAEQTAPSTATPAIDPETGLALLPGWELVRSQCTACHSAALVTQNRGDRAHWREIIGWMQETQGLWSFEPAVEAAILTYLATAYAAKEGVRRANLPADLLPPAANATPE